MAVDLFTSKDVELWKQILDRYPLVMRKKSEDKKKKDLADLDKWYQDELPTEIASRSPKCLTKEEITKLMKWKLMRGKFRPRLTELVQQNSEKEVRDSSEKAFANSKNVKDAIKELSKLKAIGPATASAIMAASNPDIYPFMADEAMASIPGFKIDYTLPAYIKFQQNLAEKAKQLKKGSEFEWTPHKVELALWTNKTAMKMGLNIDAAISAKRKETKKKTKDGDHDDVENSDDEIRRKAKKPRTK